VDILNSNLQAVEAAGFWRCDFRREITAEVLVNDAVGDEVAFIVSETIPICGVGLEVDLFGGPE